MVLTEAIAEMCMIDAEVEVRPRVVKDGRRRCCWMQPKGRNVTDCPDLGPGATSRLRE
jgi:hypothetical protein